MNRIYTLVVVLWVAALTDASRDSSYYLSRWANRVKPASLDSAAESKNNKSVTVSTTENNYNHNKNVPSKPAQSPSKGAVIEVSLSKQQDIDLFQKPSPTLASHVNTVANPTKPATKAELFYTPNSYETFRTSNLPFNSSSLVQSASPSSSRRQTITDISKKTLPPVTAAALYQRPPDTAAMQTSASSVVALKTQPLAGVTAQAGYPQQIKVIPPTSSEFQDDRESRCE